MREFAKVLGWGTIVGAVLLFPALSGAEPLGAMRIRLVQGDVQVKIAETGEWAPVSVNMPLVEGDELWVPEDGRAAIQTNNGAYVRLDRNTAFQVLRMGRDSFQVHLAQGHVYVLNRAPKRSVLQFDTPDASLRAFGKSTFRIDIPDGQTDVSVFKGSVVAENDSGTTRVRAGNMLALGADGYAELSPLPPPDDWQEWNARRDRIVLAHREGSRYLPEELRVYSSDFNDGRWVYVEDYGYCWTPKAIVIDDWAPYRHGRWVWRGGDYVWVGYEPWGWVPYHYGRWAFVPRIGWCWVPPSRGEVFWAPGYVGWVHTGDHVAWVPLAPREIYYGYGDYGRYSVNVRNVNVTQVRATNVYRNVNVVNSITVVNRATFVTGRPSPINRNVVANIRENFAQRRDVVVGRPPIKPVEASFHPVIRQIPESKRPPPAVRKIDVKELRQARPLVREPDRSALRPQAQPRPLEVRKVEKPRSVVERTRERQQVRPAERRGPDVPRDGQQPGRVNRGGKPVQAAPGPPAQRFERREVTPPAPPPEKVEPSAQPRVPGGSGERGGRPAEAAPQERVKPPRPQEAPERGLRRGRPQAVPEERRIREPAPGPERSIERARPQEPPAERAKPKEAPSERVKPEEAPPDNVTTETPRRGTERGRGGRGR
ncbi:MAG: FecR domain-containing protein [Deltaproteobacteria bacterium]|nr:FecR domain-containing protein [Deltaproteobacteria bacterium]